MEVNENNTPQKEEFGIVTKTLANICRICPVCLLADKKPDSIFGKLMRWHRKWCPTCIAHTKVYGKKPLSK